MATETGEALWAEGSAVTLNDTDSLTIANGVYSAKATTDLSTTQTEGRPLADFFCTMTFSTAPADAGKSVDLYFRYINIDGTLDEIAPDADYDPGFRGSFRMDGGTLTTVTAIIESAVMPKPSQTVEVYLKNNSGQEMTEWKLIVKPASLYPGA